MAATQEGEHVLVENVVQESGQFDKELFLQALREFAARSLLQIVANFSDDRN
jgi:hypothetical protein